MSKKLYKKLKKQGVLSLAYPSLSGEYEKDKKEWKYLNNPKREKSKSSKIPKSVSLPKLALRNETELGNSFSDWEFLESYLNGHSPSGNESEGQKIWETYMDKELRDKTKFSNSHGNLVYTIPRTDWIGSSKLPYPKVLIEAHCDEVSYIITKIGNDGLIYVVRNGGSDEAIAPSKKVVIHTNSGKVSGVFGWIAIHIRDRNVIPDRNSIFIDAGFDSKDSVIKAGIEVGNLVTYDEKCFILNDKIVGKSLDNKLGGYVISQVAKKFQNIEDRKFDLIISNSVQEEVGLLGAKMLMHNVNPDLAIVTDVTHDTNVPTMKNNLLGDIACGRGPVVVRGAAIDPYIESHIKNYFHKPYQLQACSGRGTGTDADEISYSNGGVPTTLIKFPLRYMHTTTEMCNIKDVNDTIDLIYETLVYLNNDTYSWFKK
jgi:putative aminopeptidase FrvX